MNALIFTVIISTIAIVATVIHCYRLFAKRLDAEIKFLNGEYIESNKLSVPIIPIDTPNTTDDIHQFRTTDDDAATDQELDSYYISQLKEEFESLKEYTDTLENQIQAKDVELSRKDALIFKYKQEIEAAKTAKSTGKKKSNFTSVPIFNQELTLEDIISPDKLPQLNHPDDIV